MRCICCDVELTPYESTRKTKSAGEYLDMCNTCYKHIEDDVPTIIRKDLANKREIIDDYLEDIEDTYLWEYEE